MSIDLRLWKLNINVMKMSVWDMRGYENKTRFTDKKRMNSNGTTEWQEGKSREIERERALERWNKGEADGWKWRSNWIGRFVKMWWHKQSVHCYCTLLEVEGNILKLQEKKKRKKWERKHRSCQLSARNDRLKCFLFVPSSIHSILRFSPSLPRLYLLSSYCKK